MKNSILILLAISIISCSSNDELNTTSYFSLVKKSELFICENKFKEATEQYSKAFNEIEKPFGKDLYNAALVSQLTNNFKQRDMRLQSIINNSSELSNIKSQFVDEYLSEEYWQELIRNQKIEFNPILRREFDKIHERDQLYRPNYNMYDDTINANRKINMDRILQITDSIGFPSHFELGYTNYFRGPKHNIVLHHTAQRRSKDKTVIDLEPILFKAVQDYRFDPDLAIYYINFQNDREEGIFEVYSTWQYKHRLLSDSLNNKIWLIKLDEEQKRIRNNKRKEWNANSLEEIALKSKFLATSNLPFIFHCVHKSTVNISDRFDKETALDQYKLFTRNMEEYKQ